MIKESLLHMLRHHGGPDVGYGDAEKVVVANTSLGLTEKE